MPSGPSEWHEYWTGRGPTDNGEVNAQAYMKKEGFISTLGYGWVHPTFSTWDELPEEAKYAIN